MRDDGGIGNAALEHDVESVLSATFYAPGRRDDPPPARAKSLGRGEAPGHYKVICVSLESDELDRLDGLVDALRRRGVRRASRSALIRHALLQADLHTLAGDR